MSLALANKIDILHDRAQLLASARQFFAERKVCEVDVPLLAQSGPIDVNIELVTGRCCGKPAYLHSSPEYGMKRLLAQGIGDIYQLSHVFRDGERGSRHHPEFTMVEWYRIGFTFEQMIEETLAFLRLFLNEPLAEALTYRDAFETLGGKPLEEVQDKDALFAFEIEPQLGKNGFTVLTGFPASQAALAQVRWDGKEMVAERFEIFYKGMELANGYHELTDPNEQEQRLLEANSARKALNKPQYPIDHHLLVALHRGLPDCCGVAVGFDRLMMIRHEVGDIEEVIPFAWEKT